MASIKDLKKRIGSVKNTQQTTRAMKMVSAAKLRRAQDAIQSQRPYAQQIGELISLCLSLTDGKIESPLFRAQRSSESEVEGEKPRVLLVLVTSDRGLCGGFNANVIKNAQRWVAAHKSEYSRIDLAFVGRKGHDYFKTRVKDLGPYFSEAGGKATFAKAQQLSNSLEVLFLEDRYQEIKFVYNEFKNAVTQVVQVEDFLPLTGKDKSSGLEAGAAVELPNYIVKPDLETVLTSLIQKNFSVQAFRVLLDSQASEHGARMSSMENATKNAGEMIKKLTLQYNKQRQAGITKELLEIIAGSESQKG
ncbi:MAG: ATP synthase F1 subunit gamma [Oligoflexia bacterium]|nr:ATP synthase F1 subunit gamma [Oligoflexia bacterium]